MGSDRKHILFIDGDCLLCQKSAQLLYRSDRSNKIHFSPLQGETASMLPPAMRHTTDTRGRPIGNAVLVEHAGEDDERHWQGADAILRSLLLTKGPLVILWLFYYIPGFLKNGIYRFIARNRQRLAPNRANCPLPNQAFRERFLP